MTKASIITIGDELLIGQVIDTNSAFIAKELNAIGIPVVRRVAVGDEWNEIWKALDEESSHADIILITGGLGPTADDITKPLLCKYFNGSLIIDKACLENVEHIFTNILKRPMIERNRKQAEVPDVCEVIINKRGTAPGMIFSKANKTFVSMPGVPHEMKGMITDTVLALLQKRYATATIIHKTLLTAGVGESFLAELIKDFEEQLPAHIKLAYLPNYGMVRLRLTASGTEGNSLEAEVQQLFDQLQEQVNEYLVTNEDEPMHAVIGKLLKAKGKTLCTAESCTGGYIAHLLTSMPGSSKFYEGSVVSYSYQTKENLLNVNRSTLEKEGAVSKEVVIEMAKGALNNIKADYVIAVSGIMGPEGGSAEKPVGTVWIAVGNRDQIDAQLFNFKFDRDRNMQLTAVNALNLLRKFII